MNMTISNARRPGQRSAPLFAGWAGRRARYNMSFHYMLEKSIQELESRSLARIASANTAEEVEAVRVEALGRKGGLTQFSREMGKLAPEDRARIGKLLNSVKQKVEETIEA